jgi:cytosine/adenosine deaminase-related metal-dependent hydrolase
MLAGAGVRVFCGKDDVRDTWSPYGNADTLERAAVIGWRTDVRQDQHLAQLFAMCSSVGADVLGINSHGLEVGRDANFFTIPAETIGEAIGQHPPRRLLFFKGRLVA